MLHSDLESAGRVRAIYDHFFALSKNELVASNLTLATINAGSQPVVEKDVLNVHEAAAKLGLAESTVYDLCRKGALKAMNIKPQSKRPTYRITAQAIKDFMQPPPPKVLGLRHLK